MSPCLKVLKMFAATQSRVQVPLPGASWGHSRHNLSKWLLQQKVHTNCRTVQTSFLWKICNLCPGIYFFWRQVMHSQCTTTERSAVKYNWIHPDEVQTPYKLDIFNFNIKQMLLPTMQQCKNVVLLISVNWSSLWWWSCQLVPFVFAWSPFSTYLTSVPH